MKTCIDRIPDALADALIARGYDMLTPVQRAVLQTEAIGADMLVSAATGSGKTLAFGLALGRRLVGFNRMVAWGTEPRALVITPTRELALQVQKELEWLFAETAAKVLCCAGGMDLRAERRALREGVAIVTGTPGRLCDHIRRGTLDMGEIEAVVIDEADDMLDLGFRDELEFILNAMPARRQVLMFSATVPRAIEALAGRYQHDAVRIDTRGESASQPPINYQSVPVAPEDRDGAIVNLLLFHEAQSAIVFCGQREGVGQLASRLGDRGFDVVPLSGALSQAERNAALLAMRDGRARVCVATDVAARGIDLPGLDLVIHADLPQRHEALIHRSGRTGRAGRKGLSVLLVPPHKRRRAEQLFAQAAIIPEWVPAPDAVEVLDRDRARMFEELAATGRISDEERALATELLSNLDPVALAVGLVRRVRGARPAPFILKRDPGAKGDEAVAQQGRPLMAGAVCFRFDRGRRDSIEVRRLLPQICRNGRIPRDAVGRIRILEEETLFEIHPSAAHGFAEAIARFGGSGFARVAHDDANGFAGARARVCP